MNSVNRMVERIESFGRFCTLFWKVVRRGILSPRSGLLAKSSSILEQVYRMGVESIPIVGLIAVFIGMILSLQTAYQLEQFGATLYVSPLVAVSVVRELGPLLTAILVAGRIGAGITAELGSMVVSDEVTALTTMAIDPQKFLLVPRQVALIVALPLLTVYADALACGGGMAISWAYLDISAAQFYRTGMDALVLQDVLTGFVKSVVFAVLIAAIACYKGFTVSGGATGVGEATTRTVVLSIVAIIVADLLFTVLFYFA